MSTRHAAKMEDTSDSLCGQPGNVTNPSESVNCPECRVILNHVRSAYPEHADYSDWRPTKEQKRQAANDMYRDLVLGEIEG